MCDDNPIVVPAPVILVVTADKVGVYSRSGLGIVCVVSLTEAVDTPVRVHTQWNAPTPIYGNSRVTMTDETHNDLMYKSILSIYPLSFSDAGLYTCIARIESDDSSVSGVPWATEGLNLVVCKYT